MTRSCIIKGNAINLEKVELLKVIKEVNAENESYYLDFHFESGKTFEAGPLDRTNALVILSKALESTQDSISYILDTTENIIPVVVPNKQTEEIEVQESDVQDEQTE